MKIFLIYHKLFDFDGKELSIGGIQTYLLNLSKVLLDNNLSPVIYQLANKPWVITYNGIEIRGIEKLSTDNNLRQSTLLLNEILKVADKESDLIVWGTDNISIKCKSIKTLSIQHGIGFDYIGHGLPIYPWIAKLKLQLLYKFLQRNKSIASFLRANHKVCVDYNYLNWIRTMLPREQLNNITVIPNFTHINNEKSIHESNQTEIKILFARRFTEERGVFILLDLVDSILKKYPNVRFTIAGEGKYESILRKKFEKDPKITMTKFNHADSLAIHSQHHIALVPTYGSEGTSLSLLEAMTSGCVPIASNVGGMTNIILDNYNGYLVNPSADAFIDKISFLIENLEVMAQISHNAKISVDTAFSYSEWSKKWVNLIYKIAKY